MSLLRETGKTAVAIGSTGLVGTRLLRRLLEDPRYRQVVAIARREPELKHPKLKTMIADFERLEELDLRAEAPDDWFCALGTTIKKAGSQEAFRRVDYDYPLAFGRLAQKYGAKRYLMVSALGSSAESRIFYSRVKGEIERDLADLGLPELSIFQPSLLLGERREFRLGERIAAVLMPALKPVFTGPLRKIRAVKGDEVAAAMIAVANSPMQGPVRRVRNDEIQRLAGSRVEA
jgi:Predicted nucleoside-diphosphate-sugar epimerases